MVLSSNLGQSLVSLFNEFGLLGRRADVALKLDLAVLDTFEGSTVGGQGAAEVLLPLGMVLGIELVGSKSVATRPTIVVAEPSC